MNHNAEHASISKDIALSIATQHAQTRVGDAPTWAQCTLQFSTLASGDLSPEMQGILMGCLMLGFIEKDALCIAYAWRNQTQRLGHLDSRLWPCDPQDFGLASYPRQAAFATCPKALGLYAVLPDAQWVGRMARAGVRTVQLRFKSADASAIAREVEASVRAVEGTDALLFINDHWQAAIAAGAYGVHLGQEDMQEAAIDLIRAAGLRLGLSTHGYAEMLEADRHSPSYIALGAVFPTTLKRMVTAPQGIARLQHYVNLMQHYPLVAIGGIDQARLPSVLKTGVGSVAVVRALVESPTPEATVRVFQQAGLA